MAIIDALLVNIEISIRTKDRDARLQLNYQGNNYDLVQAFASHKLELAQQRWQHQMAVDPMAIGLYLLVRETNHYSLWVLDRIIDRSGPISETHYHLGLQQASIWLFQELWIQWQDLLGERQLEIFAENLLDASSYLKSTEDLDRLLSLDPLRSEQISDWSHADLIKFDQQLYSLTNKKMGQQFGHRLITDIIESMPESLQVTLIDTLDFKTK